MPPVTWGPLVPGGQSPSAECAPHGEFWGSGEVFMMLHITDLRFLAPGQELACYRRSPSSPSHCWTPYFIRLPVKPFSAWQLLCADLRRRGSPGGFSLRPFLPSFPFFLLEGGLCKTTLKWMVFCDRPELPLLVSAMHSTISDWGDPMDCSPPGSSVRGVSQAKILEWAAVPSSRGSSRPRDRTHISCVSWAADGFFTCWVIWEALLLFGS